MLASTRGSLAAFGADRGVAVVQARDASCTSEASCWLSRGLLNKTDLAWSIRPTSEELNSVETRAVALGDGILAVGIRAIHPDFQSQQAASSGTDEA